MDPIVVAAMAKWPNVPDCRGWLSLDRRGQWRLQGSPVRHAGLAEFIGRNYACDETGAWFMQNGPQRVWVDLEATPWVFRLNEGALVTHTGDPAGELEAVWLVGGEALCFHTTHGFGLADDRDLAALLDYLQEPQGRFPDDLDALTLVFEWHGTSLPVHRCTEAELPTIGGFRRSP